jgi:carbon-monoxide dehydrogenase small subunit
MQALKREVRITVRVNGLSYQQEVPARMTLLELLRERLALTGTKEGCGIGECGACTVIMNGKAVLSCLVLAAEADGAEIRTVESELRDGKLSDLQQAFIDHGAIQCGFCTPGMVMSARDLLERCAEPSRGEIVEAIAGNLCRCTGYQPIIDAVSDVAALHAGAAKGATGAARHAGAAKGATEAAATEAAAPKSRKRAPGGGRS